LVRPLSGHFSRVAHLEDQLKETAAALEVERNTRYATDDVHVHVATKVAQALDEARKLEAYASTRYDKGLGEMVRNLVNTLDNIVVNIGKAPARNSSDNESMRDTIEGLKEENATLDKLYRQAKAELESLQQQGGGGGGGGYDSIRKKNKQLAKELEMLHKDYETLLHTKGGSDETQDESDDLFEDKRVRRKKSGFLKRIIG
jgi:hypothetical protein